MKLSRSLPFLFVVTLLAACGGDDDTNNDTDTGVDAVNDVGLDVVADSDGDAGSMVTVPDEPGCNPLVPEYCAYPFPSTFYLTEVESTETGFRTSLSEQAVPPNSSDAAAFLAEFNTTDGFGQSSPYVAIFPGGTIDTSVLPPEDDLSVGLSADAVTQIIDRDTGERLGNWSEIDLTGNTPDQQPLVIRPIVSLRPGQRVAIVVTTGLRYDDGSTPEPSPAFAALRDGTPTDNDTVEAMRPQYDSLFTFLEDNGVPRDNVLLAWESVAMSDASAMYPLLDVVSEAVAWADGSPTWEYEITHCYVDDEGEQTQFDCGGTDHIADNSDGDEFLPLHELAWRRIYGTVEMPNFRDAEGRIQYEADGTPIIHGTTPTEFIVNIPDSLRDDSAGVAPIVTFGHGLLGTPEGYIADDRDNDGQLALSDMMEAVFIGTRWIGLSAMGRGHGVAVIDDLNTAWTFRDRLVQGMVNQILLEPFVRQALMNDQLLGASDMSGSLIGDGSFYTGISLGGIFGTTYMALSPYVQSGVLHVPGSSFQNMLPHSGQFIEFKQIMNGLIPDRNDQQMFYLTAQRGFDPLDSIHYARHLTEDPLTQAGPKNVLLQCAVGDLQTPWPFCEMLARTAGLPQIDPPAWDVDDLEAISTPTEPGTSALHYYDPQLGLPSLENDRTMEAVGAHGSLRRNPEIHQQIDAYFTVGEEGVIRSFCDGRCVIDSVSEQ